MEESEKKSLVAEIAQLVVNTLKPLLPKQGPEPEPQGRMRVDPFSRSLVPVVSRPEPADTFVVARCLEGEEAEGWIRQRHPVRDGWAPL